MKSPLILLSTAALIMVGCDKKETAKAAESNRATSKVVQTTYTFDYEHDSPDYPEDHHIILTTESGKTTGVYYGTSDDFDSGREGYPPGFYSTPMQGLSLTEKDITFSLSVIAQNIHTNPLDPSKKVYNNNPEWEYGKGISLESLITLKGNFQNGEIHFKTPDGVRVFKKRS